MEKKTKISLKTIARIVMSTMIVFVATGNLSAHCDTMDGPVIKDAKQSIITNNVSYVLKWVQPHDEAELKEVFALAMRVRSKGPDAQKLADRYFFETLVRLHRNGEGVSYTGLKPSGTPVEKKILLADKSIEEGTLKSLKGIVSEDRFAELEERFNKVMKLKAFAPDDIAAGRKYVNAYVSFFKFAEGEENGHAEHMH